MYKKWAAALTAIVIATMISAAELDNTDAADSFSDVHEDYWASGPIQRMKDQGILNGNKDGTYAPNQDISRGQAASLLVAACDLPMEENPESTFNDLTDDSFSTPFAEAVREAGLMVGRNEGTEFEAAQKLSREQMATILVRAFDLEPVENSERDVTDLHSAHETHKQNVKILAQYGITSTKEGNFRPLEPVTRAQFAVFLERALSIDFTKGQGIESLRAADATSFEVTFTRDLSEEETEAQKFSFDPELDVVDSDLLSTKEDQSIVRVTTDEQIEGEAYRLYYEGTRTSLTLDAETLDGDPLIDELEVMDTFSRSLKEIGIQLNQDLSNKKEAGMVDEYQVSDKNGHQIAVEDVRVDGASIWITLEEKQDKGTEASVVLSENILGKEELFDVQFSDDTSPEARDAEVVGLRTAKVIFSEPIDPNESQLKKAFSLEKAKGSDVEIEKASLQNGGREAVLSYASDISDGRYELHISEDIVDYAGNGLKKSDPFIIDVIAEKDPPVITGHRNADSEHVTLVFNEEVVFDEDASEEKILRSFYHTNPSNSATDIDIDGSEIQLHFEEASTLPGGDVYVYVEGGIVSDLWDNVQEDKLRYTIEEINE
ncbi:S-layer homology domain-containing protein [Alteribacillus sp. HJP-4]|uniref:S-layer homology domain-containing protein n=1 Tax=Alteribacillus sp. HJP-4 TaxID=2775394 RepID=UPI0035CD39DD